MRTFGQDLVTPCSEKDRNAWCRSRSRWKTFSFNLACTGTNLFCSSKPCIWGGTSAWKILPRNTLCTSQIVWGSGFRTPLLDCGFDFFIPFPTLSVKHLENSNSPPCFQLESPQGWTEWDWGEICGDRTRRDPLGWWKEGLLGKFYHYLSSLFVYFPVTVYLFSFFFSSFEVVSILLSMIKKIRAGAFWSVLNRERRQGVRLALVSIALLSQAKVRVPFHSRVSLKFAMQHAACSWFSDGLLGFKANP